MKKKNNLIVVIVALIALVAISGIVWYLWDKGNGEGGWNWGYLDENGNEMTSSMVDNREAVYALRGTITLVNKNTQGTFTFDSASSSPSGFANAFTSNCDRSIIYNGIYQSCNPATTQTIGVGQSVSWTSAWFKTAPYESNSPTTFTFCVTKQDTYGGEIRTTPKCASTQKLIKADPSADFDIIIEIQ